MLPLPGIVSEPLAHRQDRDTNVDDTQTYFRNTVMNETGPTLFRTWKGYEAHLPRRETCNRGALRLYACNYYVTKADLDSLVSDMFKWSKSGRPDIKYGVHGSGMGKSACVLQGVLCAERTRGVRIKYIYVAFHNNRGRLFKASAANLNPNRQQAEAQGSALIVDILTAVLNPDEFEPNVLTCFELQHKPPPKVACVKNATKLLRDAAGTGAVQVHLDEFLSLCATNTPGMPIPGVEHLRTGALAVLAAAASELGICGDAAGTPRCTTMCTNTNPGDDTSRSNIDRSHIGIPCVDEQQYAAKSMPRLLDPGQCELAGAAINKATTKKLMQKGLTRLKDILRHNDFGGLTGLQTGSNPALQEFETLINDGLATTGAKLPAGCGQSVPAGIAAAVSALGRSYKKLAPITNLAYAIEMLLAVDGDLQSVQPELLKMLSDSATTGLHTLSGGRYTYELRRLLEGQPIVTDEDAQSLVLHSVCASSSGCAHAWTQPAKPLQPCATQRVPSSSGLYPVGCSSYVRALASRYSAGRDLFVDQFLEASEIMSGAPLERAYLWVLSCQSALTGKILGEEFRCASALPWTHPSGANHPMATAPTSHIATAGAKRSRRIASSRGETWTMALSSTISHRASCTTAWRAQANKSSIVHPPLSRS